MKPTQQPTVEQMLEELRQRAVGQPEPFDPVGTAKRNLTGMWEQAKKIPGNVQRMVTDPVGYAKSIPAPTGDQIMNALSPGNVGMAGIMIGPKAKTWNVDRAYQAVQMEHAGKTPQEIWQTTGTYRGPEGKWRQEIDDSKAVHRMPYEITGKAKQLAEQQQALKEAARESLMRGKEVVSDLFPKEAVAARRAVKEQAAAIDNELGGYYGLRKDPEHGNLMKYGYEHPELYAAYPEIAEYVLKQGRDHRGGALGSFADREANLYQRGLTQNPGSTIAHEMQHAIQNLEGTPRGGNPDEFARIKFLAEEQLRRQNSNLSEIAKKIDEATDPTVKTDLKQMYDSILESRNKNSKAAGIDPFNEYQALAGEAEARMIQQRLNMTPEERAATFPMDSYDVNPKHLNVIEQGAEAIPRAKGGAVQPSIAQMKLALNKQGMYSPLEKAAMAVPRTKGTPAEFMAEASKQPGFRKEEVADRKISLPEQKMTKDEFLAHLKGHTSPKLTEKIIGGDDEENEDNGYTQYDEYKLPGGTNYREVLLKTPTFPESKDRQIMELEANIRRMNPDDYAPGYVQNMIDGVAKLKAEKAAMGDNYQSSHWSDDPNVLAHIRLSDRFAGDTGKFAVEGTKDRKKRFLFSTGINGTREQAEEAAKRWQNEGYQTEINQVDGGKKLLHVEEIQSDWHQQGRKKGYKDSAKVSQHKALEDRIQQLRDDFANNRAPEDQIKAEMISLRRQQEALGNVDDRMAVPDAPFKKSWHELAMKHILNHAANNGYDGIVITPGQQQADRYNLSKKVQQIMAAKEDGGVRIFARDIQGKNHDMGVHAPEKLDSVVGKDLAQKIGAQAKPTGIYEGLDLKVGGEGMKGFYDKIVPDYLNKLGKPHGAQVQMNSVPVVTKPEKRTPQIAAPGIGHFPPDQVEPAQTADLHYFPITDTMRQQIKTEGLPQYQVGGIIHKAEGGNVQPSTAEMRMALAKHNPIELQKIGVNEAVNMSPKMFFSPERGPKMSMPPSGGVDLDGAQPGQQLMAAPPQPQGGLPGQPGQPPQPGMAPPAGPAGPTPPGGGNILQMTPQGRAMSALGNQPPAPGMPGMAKGGSAKSVDDMKAELAQSKSEPQDKRVTIKADGPGGVKGLVVPRHTLEGNAKSGAVGLHEMNEARAKVYGSEHRPPLTLNKIAQEHRNTLKEHFAKPIEEQHEAEKAALQRLRDAKHISKTANTLDKSEKLDTVRHEHDEQGRTHVGFASKGVAGHALYTSGSGKDTKYHVINTCPGQTEGCGGGKDAEGIVDTKKGTCFAPNAESQYPGAATRRAAHAQAKHDPKMTNDWILAHTGSMRNAARLADKSNQRLLFRPNVVDETDVSSRHVIRHLNEQRKAEGKPDIIANSYGKTNELHDPENGYYVTHSNVGPKVKKGKEISENIGRDKARVRNTIMAADNKGDFRNEQGNKTPPKGSYMVTDVKRNSDMSKKMEKAITHAKYWSTGREQHELTPEEKEEGPEGHFGGNGKPTTPEKAHYGHTTIGDKRFDYQKQHIVHPRLVQVGKNKDGTPHMIPTDSRFKDEEHLPKNRFKTKNGKDAGHVLMTTPTESTSNIGHQTSFTHHVGEQHIEHAQKNNGEYEIDKPEDQIKAAGKEYTAPQSIKFYAEGGNVGHTGRHPGLNEDDFHAFPEQNYAAQRHMAMRGHDYEKPQTSSLPYHAKHKKAVVVQKDMDTIRFEMIKKAK